MMYSKSRQSIEQICVCRIDEMIKPLAITEGVRKTASPEADTGGGVYRCPERPNECHE